MKQQIIDIIKRYLNEDDVQPHDSLINDLYIDSLDRMELSIMIEKEIFPRNVFSDEEIESWETVQDIINTAIKHSENVTN